MVDNALLPDTAFCGVQNVSTIKSAFDEHSSRRSSPTLCETIGRSLCLDQTMRASTRDFRRNRGTIVRIAWCRRRLRPVGEVARRARVAPIGMWASIAGGGVSDRHAVRRGGWNICPRRRNPLPILTPDFDSHRSAGDRRQSQLSVVSSLRNHRYQRKHTGRLGNHLRRRSFRVRKALVRLGLSGKRQDLRQIYAQLSILQMALNFLLTLEWGQ